MWSQIDDEWLQFEGGRSCLRGGQLKITAWNNLFPDLSDFWFSQLCHRPSLIPIVWSGLRDTCIYRPINGKLCPTFMELRMVIQCEHLIWSRIAVFVQPSTSNTFKVKKGNICLCVWVLKIMSVFVCSKELCVNIFFDCCKVLAAPLKRTFPPFFSNRMYLLKRQSRKKIQFLTWLAS